MDRPNKWLKYSPRELWKIAHYAENYDSNAWFAAQHWNGVGALPPDSRKLRLFRQK